MIDQTKTTASVATKTVFLGNLVINTFIQAGLSQLLSAVGTLQIMSHVALANIKLAPNAQIFFSLFFEIIAFDLVET